MFELLILVLFGAIGLRAMSRPAADPDDVPHRIAGRLTRLWDVAQDGMRDRKFLRAEKALLTILKIDEKNAAAYNRLGILYAKQKEYDDAIDCFEIATTIERTASGLHNLGLIYFETEQYEKAEIAFKQAIELEGDLAARHIAYAKALERQNKTREMISALEKAAELEANPETLSMLSKAHENHGDEQEAKKLKTKLSNIKNKKIKKKVKRPEKAVM